MITKPNRSGWFLTEPQMQNIKHWKYCVEDQSISTLLLTPWWNWALTWIPMTVAPNILTLAGFLCLIQSAYLTYYKLEDYSTLVTLANMFLLFAYQTLDALDGKHARKTRNCSPVGELFDHTVDNIGVILIIMTMCWTFGLHDPAIQWYFVNGVQLLFMWTHLVALKNTTIEFGQFTGPGEVLLGCMTMLGMKIYCGFQLSLPDWAPLAFFYGYLTMIALVAGYAAFMNYSTRNGIWLCLFFRTLAAMISYDLHTPSRTSMLNLDVFCDGLFWCLVTGDLILAKMAKRELHPTIVIFSMITFVSNWLVLLIAIIYYLSTFSDLLNYLNIPMFSMIRTVYVNGVYDVAHYNHMKSFEKALEVSDCNRLIVGVMSDEDTKSHKGAERPYDPLKDRVNFVEGCRAVSTVIPNAPWDDVPQDFIDKWGIDIVCHSSEYNPNDADYAYRTPNQLGIVRLIPRSEGISTSKRVDRIKEAQTNE